MNNNTIEPDTYMSLSQQYIKDEISDEEFTKRCNRLKKDTNKHLREHIRKIYAGRNKRGRICGAV